MADTATAGKALSTARVSPQDRGFDSDIEQHINFSMPAGSDQEHTVVLSATGLTDVSLNWFPGEKVQITKITMANGLVAQAADTTTTALDVDIEDNAGTKTHDVATKAASLAVAADVAVELTLSSTAADLVVEATEIVKVGVDVLSTQGEFSVSISYKKITARVETRSWFPQQKIRITRISMSNGDVAQEATINTTVLDIDSEDNAGAKVADVASLVATAIAVDVATDLTLSTTEANLVIEIDETLKIAASINGVQGEFDVAVSFVALDVRDTSTVWPAA